MAPRESAPRRPPRKLSSSEFFDELYGPVRARIIAVLRKRGMGKRAAEEASFHLLDWKDDLERLARVYRNPERYTDLEIKEAIVRFIVHAPNHIVAAHLIIDGDPVRDIFQLGAVKGTGKPKRKPGGSYPDDSRQGLKPKRWARKA